MKKRLTCTREDVDRVEVDVEEPTEYELFRKKAAATRRRATPLPGHTKRKSGRH